VQMQLGIRADRSRNFSVQQTFDLDTETFSEREKLIIKRLGEYRTIDADIRRQERIISGELTNCLPPISIRRADEDDIGVLASLQEPVSDNLAHISKVVGEHVDMSGATYTDRLRVAKRLRHIYSDDEKADQALQDAYVILTERGEELAVHLTPAERYASDREHEVEQAKVELERLTNLRRVIRYALDDLHEYHAEWWTILWYKYVQREHWRKVCERASREGTPLTADEYRTSRRKGLQKFDKWAVGLH